MVRQCLRMGHNHAMCVDLVLQPHPSAPEFVALGELAESYGISGVWVSNRLDGRDPFVNFAQDSGGRPHLIFDQHQRG